MSYTGKTIDLSKYEKYGKKVELSKVEVELANIKDIPRKLKSVFDWQKKLDKSMPALEKLEKDVKEQKGMLDLMVKEAEDILEEVGKKSKDLGIEPSSIDGYNQLKTEISNSRSEYLK
jgi:predicted transcriptional regulator